MPVRREDRFRQAERDLDLRLAAGDPFLKRILSEGIQVLPAEWAGPLVSSSYLSQEASA